MKHMFPIVLAVLACAAPGAAQGVPSAEAELRVVELLQLERARAGVESRITKGAPYSGEAVTETVQVLADGNRIARKSTTRIYRDSEGRTRREQLSPNGEVSGINISDPVAESQYVLNPQTKTAHRNGVIMATGGGFAFGSVTPGSDGTVIATRTPDGNASVEARSANAEAERRREVEVATAAAAGGGGRGGVGVAAGGVGAGRGAGAGSGGGGSTQSLAYAAEASGTLMRMPASSNVNREELGQQVIEGVMATGTRSTTTIPAGAIGNVEAIHIVSEQWFSEDLKVLVQTRHSDPRSGETTYRLMNIVQAEPHHALFEVPPDYTVKDSVIHMRRQSPLKQQ